MRIMGLDIGTKRVGVAISDQTCTLAQGKEVIQRTSDERVIERITELVSEFKVKEIVVGLPINMDGSRGASAKNSEEFSDKLKKQTSLPLRLWDERLSTKEVEQVLIEASTRRAKRKQIIDKLAAQIILQGYLDSLHV